MRPNPNTHSRRRPFRIWAAVLVSVVALVACDGGDPTPPDNGSGTTEEDAAASPTPTTSSPEEYAATMCTEMQNWLTKLQEGQAQVAATIEPGASPEEGRDAMASFFAEAVAATEDLLAAIDELGTPEVEGGEQIAAELTTRFEEARVALQDARERIDALPVNDRAAFVKEAAKLRETVQTQLKSIGKALATLSQPELDQAAASEPACSTLSPIGG